MKKIKVCYAITKGDWGGAQKYVYDLATSLPKEKYDICVIHGQGNMLARRLKKDFPDGEERTHIRIHKIDNLARDISLKNEWESFLEIWQFLKKENSRFDILHLNSPKMAGLGSLLGRLCGIKKIIYTVHGFAFNEDRNIVSKVLIWFFSWITILLCHKTIIIDKKEYSQSLQMPFVKKRIVFIHNGIGKINFTEKIVARNVILKKPAFEPMVDEMWLVTVAELHKNKGLEYAIEAAKDIQEPFKFFIVGDGEERESLKKLINVNNLQNKVIAEFLFISSIEQLLKGFDIFLLPSIKEGLPYVLLEAGQAGLPVIASDVGGIPDIVENDKTGMLVQPKNVAEITKAIQDLIAHPEKRDLLGKNLKEKVEKEFSLNQMLEKTINLYE